MWAAIAQSLWRLAADWPVWESNPMEARFSAGVHTAPAAHPGPYTVGNGSVFRG
jgi:hypothetical protein